MIPVIATEIEFYLFGSHERDLASYWQEVRAACVLAAIDVFKIEKERGREQHEVALCHTSDIKKIVADTNRLKTFVADIAARYGMRADFSAKPLADEPGSGLHIHVHLEDDAGKNLFCKDDQQMSEALSQAIAGLLATMQENMAVFVPTAESGKRFVLGSNAPTRISWGANNRTCAIRLPDKPHDNKHIEHRVAGADADVALVIDAILRGIRCGIEQQLVPPPQIYGDASLAMYGLPKLFHG